MAGGVVSVRTETIGDCVLHLGDCREVAWPPAAAIVSDPPYGISYQRGAGGKGASNTHCDGAIEGDDQPFDPAPWLAFPYAILWGSNHYAARLPHGRWLAWDKLAGVQSFDDFSDVEFAWCKGRGKDRIFPHLWKGMLRASEKDASRVHPTQKPVALFVWCVRQIPEKHVIVDPYMGSGTCGIACAELGRPFIGAEIDERHFSTACRRIEAAYRQPRLFDEPPPKPVQASLLETAE